MTPLDIAASPCDGACLGNLEEFAQLKAGYDLSEVPARALKLSQSAQGERSIHTRRQVCLAKRVCGHTESAHNSDTTSCNFCCVASKTWTRIAASLTLEMSRSCWSGVGDCGCPLLGQFSLPQLGPHWQPSPQQQLSIGWGLLTVFAQGAIASEGHEPQPLSETANAATSTTRNLYEERFMALLNYTSPMPVGLVQFDYFAGAGRGGGEVE